MDTNLTRATLGQGQFLFSILPLFVQHSMRGEFPHSIVIMMGWTGLENSNMAQAFVSKGARLYASWGNPVTSDRTDNAMITLLRSLSQGKTIQQAVSTAMDQSGPDPVYNSQLGYYPEDQGGLALSLRYGGTMQSIQTAEVSVPSSPSRFGH